MNQTTNMAVPTLIRSHSWSSSISLLSSSPSTEYTTSGSSSSTIPGPGAITGKAVKALGRATLRGFDRIIIAKHLATITRIFPHTDEEGSHIRNINSTYDDLLEFSRYAFSNQYVIYILMIQGPECITTKFGTEPWDIS